MYCTNIPPNDTLSLEKDLYENWKIKHKSHSNITFSPMCVRGYMCEQRTPSSSTISPDIDSDLSREKACSLQEVAAPFQKAG